MRKKPRAYAGARENSPGVKSLVQPLARESGVIRKRGRGLIRVALLYPNQYETAMGNLGFHQVYHLFNQAEEVSCERVLFTPGAGEPVSVESGSPLSSFELIAVSLSYEADLPKVAAMLYQAGLGGDVCCRDLTCSSRPKSLAERPLIIAGGVLAFLNPEPLAPLVDVIAVGEGEELVPLFLSVYLGHRRRPRREVLTALSAQPGFYVPSLYNILYKNRAAGIERKVLVSGAPETVRRVITKDISKELARTRIFTSSGEFSDLALVELSRGCPHGCRFCAAAFIYRPVRWARAKAVLEALEEGLRKRPRAGLVSASGPDHPEFSEICANIRQRGKAFSPASLRLDGITPELLAELYDAGHKTLTLAPEAGSERLRRIINKPFSHRQILEAAEMVGASGLPRLKLYFQIGLPFETAEDIDELIHLAAEIRQALARGAGRRGWPGRLTVSVNPFVPKPGTPFQWHAMERPESLAGKYEQLRRSLGRLAGVSLSLASLREATLQAIICRGDRRIGLLLSRAPAEKRTLLSLLKAEEKEGLTLEGLVHRPRSKEEVLPWDFIDHRVSKELLWEEYERAQKGLLTPACRPGSGCQRCQACEG